VRPHSSNELRTAAREALNAFGLGGSRLTTLDRRRNAVFRVDADNGQRFALRLRSADRFNDAAARVQVRWLQRLDGVVPRPLRTKDNQPFVRLRVGEELWRATCLTWVPGRTARASAFVKPDSLRAVGRTVAQLHNSAQRYGPAAMAQCPQLDAKYFFGPQTCVGPIGRSYLTASQHTLVRRAADRIRRAMRRTRHSPRHVGLIHGDLEPPNWVFSAGLARPIDFDEFGVGPFLFDLLQVIWTHALWPQYPRFRADLLAGYESLRPLPPDDRRELDLYQAIPFLVWLNRGASQNVESQSEFRKWLEPTLRRIEGLSAEL
jgi:Ser/Thr protein kinase RdoA (MazF antagonist)